MEIVNGLIHDKSGVTFNQFITLAIAEKLSALTTESVLEERAVKGNRKLFLQVLQNVPDQPPEDEEDKL